MKKILPFLFAMILAFMVIVLFVLIFTLPAMLLWNALIPELFHGPILSFWQTFGILILSRLLISTGSKLTTNK